MTCPYCGAALRADATFCEQCGAAVCAAPSLDQMMDQASGFCAQSYDNGAELQGYMPEDYAQTEYVPVDVPRRSAAMNRGQRKKPSLALRIPLQIVSLFLSIVLMVCLLATALLLDCNRMLSAGGIKQIMKAVFSTSQSKPVRPVSGAVGVHWDEVQIPELPSDVLASGDTDALVDWLCDMVEQTVGQDIDVDKEQLQAFVEQSTLTDYMAEKAASYAQDFINGTRDTLISSQELMELIEENEDLIEDTFQVDFTREMKQELETALQKTIEENKLNEMIHEQVFEQLETTLNQSLPVGFEQLQALLQALTNDTLVLGAVAVCLVIMLLLCALNFYNVPAGMTWSAVPCILVGGLLALPVALLQSSPALLTDILPIPGSIVQLITSFLSAFGLVHYGLLLFGVVLLILSIVWRIVRASRRTYVF